MRHSTTRRRSKCFRLHFLSCPRNPCLIQFDVRFCCVACRPRTDSSLVYEEVVCCRRSLRLGLASCQNPSRLYLFVGTDSVEIWLGPLNFSRSVIWLRGGHLSWRISHAFFVCCCQLKSLATLHERRFIAQKVAGGALCRLLFDLHSILLVTDRVRLVRGVFPDIPFQASRSD